MIIIQAFKIVSLLYKIFYLSTSRRQKATETRLRKMFKIPDPKFKTDRSIYVGSVSTLKMSKCLFKNVVHV